MFLQFIDFLKDPDSNSAENGTRFTDPQTATALENCTESNQNETDSVNVIATKDSIAGKKKIIIPYISSCYTAVLVSLPT